MKPVMKPERTMPALMALSPNFVDLVDAYVADMEKGLSPRTKLMLSSNPRFAVRTPTRSMAPGWAYLLCRA